MVVARIHPLRDEDEILNPTLPQHYRSLLQVIELSASSDDTQRLALTYYLLLQNRIDQAMETFSTVKTDKIDSQLQYDYTAAYLALHRGDYDVAEKVAIAHKNHPIPRWRSRFGTIANHINQRQKWMVASQPIIAVSPASSEAVRNDEADF